jgi:serine O-acetyltransferase
LPAAVRRLNILLTGADIHPKATFEKKVVFIHSVGTIIGEGVVIKSGSEIYGGVLLGGRGGRRSDDGNPVIDTDCVICSGAIIIGNIKIGKNVTVAAGSVVLESVPDKAMVAGNPATIKAKYDH